MARKRAGRKQQGWRNWGANIVTAEPPRAPRTLDELLGWVRADEKPIRIAGAGHSWAPLVPSAGHIIDLSLLNALEPVNAAEQTVRVQGGARIHDVTQHLAAQGWALANLSSISDQTIAGALATATHGSGPHAEITEAVACLEILRADGELVSLHHTDPQFAEAAIHLGCLGIVCWVTLKVEPAFCLQQMAHKEPVNTLFEDASWLSGPLAHTQAHWFPHCKAAVVVRRQKPGTEHVADTRYRAPVRASRGDRSAAALALTLGRWLPRAAPALASAKTDALLRSLKNTVDRSDQLFSLPAPFRYWESEFAFARETAPAALEALRSRLEALRPTVAMPVTIRPVPASSFLLSPAFGRPSVYISVLGPCAHQAFSPIAEALWAVAKQFGGRPHWAKLFIGQAFALDAVFQSNMQRFARLARAFDPAGRFANRYLRDTFGI